MNPVINQVIGFAKQEAEVLAPAAAEKQSHVWKVDAAGMRKLNKILSWCVAKQPCMTAKVLLVKIFKLLESGTDAELLAMNRKFKELQRPETRETVALLAKLYVQSHDRSAGAGK